MAFKSSSGRDVGKEVKTYQSDNIGQGIGGAGGGAGGGYRFTGFNPEPVTINNNGTPVGVTTSSWTPLSYTNASYYENEGPGRYFDISVRTPDAGGGPVGSYRSGSISGTVYIEKDSQIYIQHCSGGSPGGGSGAAIVNVNSLEPETDRPGSALMVAGGNGGNSPNQARSGGSGGGTFYKSGSPGSVNGSVIGDQRANGSPGSHGAGGANQTAAGGGQSGNPAPNSGNPGGVWTGGPANSGGGGRSGGGGGGWYGGGGGANNGPGGPWGGGGGGSAYLAAPGTPVVNPKSLEVEIASVDATTTQTTFNNGTFLANSGRYFTHADYPGTQAAGTVFIRIAN